MSIDTTQVEIRIRLEFSDVCDSARAAKVAEKVEEMRWFITYATALAALISDPVALAILALEERE